MSKIINLISKPYMARYYITRLFSRLVSDEAFIEATYQANFGRRLDWDNPQTYNEKLQWLKLYDRNPYYSELVDKDAVKRIVEHKVGPMGIRIVPTLGVYDHFDKIDFGELPEAFVLKCTHDSGSVVICKNKAHFDKAAARDKLEKALKRDYYLRSREFPYKNVAHKIIVEPYLSELGEGRLLDYKLFCFNGKVYYLFIASDRDTEVKFDYFDADFKRLDMRQAQHPTSQRVFEMPDCFEIMKQAAESLSEGIPQVRVDFYIINNEPYFGEMTFFHHGGFVPFIPDEMDFIWGSKIKLPSRQRAK